MRYVRWVIYNKPKEEFLTINNNANVYIDNKILCFDYVDDGDNFYSKTKDIGLALQLKAQVVADAVLKDYIDDLNLSLEDANQNEDEEGYCLVDALLKESWEIQSIVILVDNFKVEES